MNTKAEPKSVEEIVYTTVLDWNDKLKIGKDGAPSKRELTLLINNLSQAIRQQAQHTLHWSKNAPTPTIEKDK